MENLIKKIGILGGTFDPVHLGHLLVAEVIKDNFGLDKVVFMPSGNPPHKKDQEVTGPEHRYNMVCEAIKDNPFFTASRIEIDRQGYTYTIDTLRELTKVYGSSAVIYYLIGADVLFDLINWRDFKEVFKTCEFIATLRPGYDNEEFDNQRTLLINVHGAKISKTHIPLIDISSTDIRNRAKSGKSIRYMVPQGVEKYITYNRIYGGL